MKHDKGGYLSACFLSKNETRVEVQFGFQLVNHVNDVHSKRNGKKIGFWTIFEAERCLIGSLHAFTFIDDCCEVKLLPCTETVPPDRGFWRIPNYGFLRDDHFLVCLDMRVKQKDNELCEVTVDGKTATCQVSFFCVRCMVSHWSWSLVEVEIPKRNESMARCDYNHQN